MRAYVYSSRTQSSVVIFEHLHNSICEYVTEGKSAATPRHCWTLNFNVRCEYCMKHFL